MKELHEDAADEVRELSIYISGYAAGNFDEKLAKAAVWLDELSRHVCAQGYIGCKGGSTCSSDHK